MAEETRDDWGAADDGRLALLLRARAERARGQEMPGLAEAADGLAERLELIVHADRGVPRGDFSKPPPGFFRGHDSQGEPVIQLEGGGGACWTLTAAWAHRDPPGMMTHFIAGEGWWVQVFDCPAGESDDNHVGPTRRPLADLAAARAAAWAWYERRLALVLRLEANDGKAAAWNRLIGDAPDIDIAGLWPLALTWSDEQVAEVERWLVDSTAELPEVLRG